MPKRVPLTPQQEAWLRQAVADGLTYTAMAAEIGCCTDTLKRILHRRNIVQFDGAKYQTPPSTDTIMWERPCNQCGDRKPRPKWTYICDTCKKRLGWEQHSDDEPGFYD